jgi:Reverse transcriptase (RNA-dependent DNA polymerase).
MIFTSRQLIEKAIEQNTSLSIRFIDIQKAFDTVDREILYKILEKTKCPPTTLEILKSLHTETKSRVRTENETSPHL